jgi:hypothetical protein
MRKRLIQPLTRDEPSTAGQWLDLAQLAAVEVTSEDASHPIESALIPDGSPGWRASDSGTQTIRILFDQPRSISRIHLEFHEDQQSRTQEFVLRIQPANGGPHQELVRQQYNFSPNGSTDEVEDYTAILDKVSAVELSIVPDIGGGSVRASLRRLLIR